MEAQVMWNMVITSLTAVLVVSIPILVPLLAKKDKRIKFTPSFFLIHPSLKKTEVLKFLTSANIHGFVQIVAVKKKSYNAPIVICFNPSVIANVGDWIVSRVKKGPEMLSFNDFKIVVESKVKNYLRSD